MKIREKRKMPKKDMIGTSGLGFLPFTLVAIS
jgi:hypothetical protein